MLISCCRWNNVCKDNIAEQLQLSQSSEHFDMVLAIFQGWGQVQLTKYSSTPSTPNIYQVQVQVQVLILNLF